MEHDIFLSKSFGCKFLFTQTKKVKDMGLVSARVQLISLPPNGFRSSKHCRIRRPFQPPRLRFQSTFPSTLIKCNINLGDLNTKKRAGKVCSSLQQVEDDIDDEACELVNGLELSIGEGDDTIPAYLFKAVKNNNGTGILLLSDIFGFEDSSTREFAYRVACNGFNVLLPDLYRGDPWTKKKPETILGTAKQDLQRVIKDVETATKWLVDEFLAAGISKKLGLMGFGYGGGRVVEVLAKDQGACFAIGASFYGTNVNPSFGPNVKVPVLLISGDNDPLSPVSVLKDLEKGIARGSKLVIFQGRGHGFVHKPGSPEEDEEAEQAFLMLRNWLHDGLVVNI